MRPQLPTDPASTEGVRYSGYNVFLKKYKEGERLASICPKHRGVGRVRILGQVITGVLCRCDGCEIQFIANIPDHLTLQHPEFDVEEKAGERSLQLMLQEPSHA